MLVIFFIGKQLLVCIIKIYAWLYKSKINKKEEIKNMFSMDVVFINKV